MRGNPLLRSLWVAFLVVALLRPESARSSVVEDLTIAELTARATAVVHGRVTAVESCWDDARERIYTTTTLEVIAYLSGQGPGTVTVRQVGGRVGDTELRIDGQPSFVAGEQVVVFLEPLEGSRDGAWVVVALASGKFTVSTDGVTGELVLRRDVEGLTPVRVGPAGVSPARRTSRVVRPLLLRELIEEVRRGGAGGRP